MKRGRGLKAIVADLKEKRDSCGVYGATFIDGIPEMNKRKVEEQYQKGFFQWWDTWVSPLINEIEDKIK